MPMLQNALGTLSTKISSRSNYRSIAISMPLWRIIVEYLTSFKPLLTIVNYIIFLITYRLIASGGMGAPLPKISGTTKGMTIKFLSDVGICR